MAPIRLINVIRSTFVPTLRRTQRLVNVGGLGGHFGAPISLARYWAGAARAYVTVWWLSSVPSSRTQSATP